MTTNEFGQSVARITLEFVATDPTALTEAWTQGDLQARLVGTLGKTAATLGIELNLEVEQPIDERLLQPAMSIFPQHPTGEVAIDRIVNRINTCFYSQGVTTVRDLLAIGRKNVADFRNFGEKATEAVDAALAGQDFGIEWGPNPTPAAIATMYKNFSEVPVAVLGYTPNNWGDAWYRTVEELRHADPEELAKQLGSTGLPATRFAKQMIAKAEQFFNDFNAAAGQSGRGQSN